jgi:hypothetical protein
MIDVSSYCRAIESYLCQKNAGHLIRVVGPSFEMVSGWAERGVPLKVAYRGVDRYCERYYAKGNRRRPVRIEFCEPDVLDAFDEWQRAVGVAPAHTADDTAEAEPRKPPLAQHLERALARLSGGVSRDRSTAFNDAIAGVTRELTRLGADAGHARGEARASLIDRVRALDMELMQAAVSEIESEPVRADALKREAEEELAPFRGRMAPDVRERSLAAAYQRLVREALGLPVVTYE